MPKINLDKQEQKQQHYSFRSISRIINSVTTEKENKKLTIPLNMLITEKVLL